MNEPQNQDDLEISENDYHNNDQQSVMIKRTIKSVWIWGKNKTVQSATIAASALSRSCILRLVGVIGIEIAPLRHSTNNWGWRSLGSEDPSALYSACRLLCQPD